MAIDRFVINKTVDNTYKFTIKKDGSIMPLVLEAGDTFSYKLITLDNDAVALAGSIPITDAENGEVTMTVSSAQAAGLVSTKGEVVDGRFLKPTYRLLVSCNTAGNGAFVAKVPKVYVE